jgi:RNA polymerase sigma-70 factor (ECF subfamily)
VAEADDSDLLLAEEHRLVRRAQRGDRAALGRLAEHHYDRLYRWLFHLTHDRHAAEDLVQETLLTAFAALPRFRAGSNFRAWLFRIAHNNFINQRRAAVKQGGVLGDNLAAPGDEPVDQLARREAEALARDAIRALPPEFRAALLLRIEEGLSFREIAGVLGLTEETARWRVFKARQKLMRALTPSLEQEKP